MPAITPDAHGIAVLLLTAAALYLFTRDNLPLETSSLAVLIVLVAGFQFFPYEGGKVPLRPVDFFAGLGNEALVTICALMMVGKALETTGALQPLATVVGRAWSSRPVLALLVTLLSATTLSAFLNNTPIVVLLMPILVGVSLRVKFPVSEVMLPMGFATIIGGMTTTIGTSTNLLAVGIAQDMGVKSFDMFEFVLPAVIVGVVLCFVLFVGWQMAFAAWGQAAAVELPMTSASQNIEEAFPGGTMLSTGWRLADGRFVFDYEETHRTTRYGVSPNR